MLRLTRLLWRVPPLLMLVGLLGQVDCAGQSEEAGSDCASLCEKGMKDCPALPRADCDSQCLYEDARAEQTGCRKRVKAIAQCSAALEDICTTATACKPEVDEFWACIAVYCAKHPSSQYCPMDHG